MKAYRRRKCIAPLILNLGTTTPALIYLKLVRPQSQSRHFGGEKDVLVLAHRLVTIPVTSNLIPHCTHKFILLRSIIEGCCTGKLLSVCDASGIMKKPRIL